MSAVVNGASFQPGPVAPGEIVSIFGTNLGPAVGVGARLTPSGFVDNFVANTRVLFDGVPAPLLYVQANQMNAVVPYAVAGKSTAALQIESAGVRSNVLNITVAASAPGIFTAQATGTGQGAILNEDGSLNSSSNPATIGSIVVLYATGEGQTSPPGIDGKLAADPLPRPLLPVSVTIGGRPAEILYAGAAPGFAGLLQVNARIRELSSSALVNVGVSLTIGAARSQLGVGLAVNPLPAGISVFPGAASAEILFPPNGSTFRVAPGETYAAVPVIGRVLAEFDFQATVPGNIGANASFLLPIRTQGACTFLSQARAAATYEVGQQEGRVLVTLIVPDQRSRNGIVPDPCQRERELRVTIAPAGKPFLDMTPLPNRPSISTDGTGELLYGSQFNGLSARVTFLPQEVDPVFGPRPVYPFGRVDLFPPGNYSIRLTVDIGGIRVAAATSSFSVAP